MIGNADAMVLRRMVAVMVVGSVSDHARMLCCMLVSGGHAALRKREPWNDGAPVVGQKSHVKMRTVKIAFRW